ncbi:GNAT family N-acetyltransferase [Pseudoroseicyclus sp. CXY001]|uniref:GNAT family N-acetyltransferase n=1 Tax=Pseudoroseicyclus sp. CXY001 TaxID=3242492 RepID=UPI0035716C4F
MSLPELRTARLRLRPLQAADAPAVAEGIGDWRVMQWLSSPPWPYRLADAEWFIGDDASAGAFAIEMGGRVVGIVDAADEFGYWLAVPVWGQGIMSEAARAVLGWRFVEDQAPLLSGYFLGNGPSRAVLTKLGFAPTRLLPRFHCPMGQTLALQEMVLTREAWEAVR